MTVTLVFGLVSLARDTWSGGSSLRSSESAGATRWECGGRGVQDNSTNRDVSEVLILIGAWSLESFATFSKWKVEADRMKYFTSVDSIISNQLALVEANIETRSGTVYEGKLSEDWCHVCPRVTSCAEYVKLTVLWYYCHQTLSRTRPNL